MQLFFTFFLIFVTTNAPECVIIVNTENNSITKVLYGHENEMYKEPMNLKRGKGVYMRELRECGGRTEDKTKCAKG